MKGRKIRNLEGIGNVQSQGVMIFYGTNDKQWRNEGLFIFYVNDLPFHINSDSKLVLFVDDTSVIITASNLSDLQTKAIHTLTRMNGLQQMD